MGKKDKIKLKLTTLVRIFMRVVLIKLNCTRCEALALGASWRVLLVPMVAAARTVPKSGQRYYSAAQAAPATKNSAVSCVEFAHASEALCCADFLPTQVSLTAFFFFLVYFFRNRCLSRRFGVLGGRPQELQAARLALLTPGRNASFSVYIYKLLIVTPDGRNHLFIVYPWYYMVTSRAHAT